MSTWWINFFKDLVDEGVFDPSSSVQLKCMQFCFLHIIQRELDQTVAAWNSHCIRKSRYDTVAGIPNELYNVPEINDVEDHKVSVEQNKLDEVKRYLSMSQSSVEHENEHHEYFTHLVATLGCTAPLNWHDALDLYKLLINYV